MATYLEIFRAVQSSKADCVWIGLSAAAMYGSPFVSYDYDFFVRPDASHLDRVRATLRSLGMCESLPDMASSNIIAIETTVSFADPMGGPTVDLMTHISGPTFDEVWQGHQVKELEGVRVRVASLEHIVASKRAANREKDRYALKRLEEELGREVKEMTAKYRASKKKK